MKASISNALAVIYPLEMKVNDPKPPANIECNVRRRVSDITNCDSALVHSLVGDIEVCFKRCARPEDLVSTSYREDKQFVEVNKAETVRSLSKVKGRMVQWIATYKCTIDEAPQMGIQDPMELFEVHPQTVHYVTHCYCFSNLDKPIIIKFINCQRYWLKLWLDVI
jgi:hypothetical protein